MSSDRVIECPTCKGEGLIQTREEREAALRPERGHVCEACEGDGEIENPDYDPTPWCTGCGARRRKDCHCGPIAENE